MPTLPEEFGVEVGGLAAFQTSMVEEGYSARQALQEFRNYGGAIRDARWYASYAEVQAAIANREVVTGIPTDAVPDLGHFTTWQGIPEGKYGYAVNIQVEDAFTDELGITRYTSTFEPTMVISERPITIEEAYVAAGERWQESLEMGQDSPHGTITGFSPRGLFVRG